MATLLRVYGETREIFDELYYWAPAESRQTEVDFVLKRGREFLGIEVKSASRISHQDLRGLRAIADLPGILRRVVVYTGKRVLKTEHGIEIWPLEMFLDSLAMDRLWP